MTCCYGDGETWQFNYRWCSPTAVVENKLCLLLTSKWEAFTVVTGRTHNITGRTLGQLLATLGHMKVYIMSLASSRHLTILYTTTVIEVLQVWNMT